MRRLCSILAILILVVTFAYPSTVEAATTAITIKLSSTEGDNVSIQSGSGKELTVREGMTLYNQYTVSTGKESYAYLMLDKTKAVKLDQNTEITIVKEGRKNEIQLESGELFFDVSKKLTSQETLKVKTSNSTMGIRGTSGVVKVITLYDKEMNSLGTSIVYQIYDGKVVVEYSIGANSSLQKKEAEVVQGTQFVLTNSSDIDADVVLERIPHEELPSFALKEVLKNQTLKERVIQGMGIGESELEAAYEDAKEREEKEKQVLENKINEIIEALEKNISNNVYPTSVPTSTPVPAPSPEFVTPSVIPTVTPTGTPTDTPTAIPTSTPTETPTETPTGTPTETPTVTPTEIPTEIPEGTIYDITPMAFDDGSNVFDSVEVNSALADHKLVRLSKETEESIDCKIQGNGQLRIPSESYLIVSENISIDCDVNIENQGYLFIESEGYFKSRANCWNDGTIINKGTLENCNGATITNNGTLYIDQNASFQNNGQMTNAGETILLGDIDNYGGANFYNSGSIAMKENSRFYNHDLYISQEAMMEKGAEFTNHGTMNVFGTFTNGSNENINQLKDAFGRACLVNDGIFVGTISNYATGYLQNQAKGSITCLTNQNGVYRNEGNIPETNGTNNSEIQVYMITVVRADGIPEYMLQSAASLYYLDWPEQDSSYGYDTDICSQEALNDFENSHLVVSELTTQPDAVFECNSNYQSKYRFGCDFSTALNVLQGEWSEADKAMLPCEYSSMTLYKDFILQNEIPETDIIQLLIEGDTVQSENDEKAQFRFNLNGHQMDFTGREQQWDTFTQKNLELIYYGMDAQATDVVLPEEDQIIMDAGESELMLNLTKFYDLGIQIKGYVKATQNVDFTNCRIKIDGGNLIAAEGVTIGMYESNVLNVIQPITTQEAVSGSGISVVSGSSLSVTGTLEVQVQEGYGIMVDSGANLIFGDESGNATINVNLSPDCYAFYLENPNYLERFYKMVTGTILENNMMGIYTAKD